jgi:hypothetical protein
VKILICVKDLRIAARIFVLRLDEKVDAIVSERPGQAVG